MYSSGRVGDDLGGLKEFFRSESFIIYRSWLQLRQEFIRAHLQQSVPFTSTCGSRDLEGTPGLLELALGSFWEQEKRKRSPHRVRVAYRVRRTRRRGRKRERERESNCRAERACNSILSLGFQEVSANVCFPVAAMLWWQVLCNLASFASAVALNSTGSLESLGFLSVCRGFLEEALIIPELSEVPTKIFYAFLQRKLGGCLSSKVPWRPWTWQALRWAVWHQPCCCSTLDCRTHACSFRDAHIHT